MGTVSARLTLLLSVVLWAWTMAAYPASAKPNIIVIMTDDMGFSDLGCYGSEIETPTLDGLAGDGLRFTQFYNTSRCCPTRASLLTGLYAHQAGMGGSTGDEGKTNPGYRGRLMERCVTIAEALRPAGYVTIQTGKWHVGDRKKAWWPLGRGFDHCYSCPGGGGFYFRPSAFIRPRRVIRGNEVLYSVEKDPPDGWYATDAYTDEGLAYIREAVGNGRPFFWYLAYNAPHYPLKAKPQDIAKYRGRYKSTGWDVIRKQRHERLIQQGIIDPMWRLSPRPANVPAWEEPPHREALPAPSQRSGLGYAERQAEGRAGSAHGYLRGYDRLRGPECRQGCP